MDATRPWRRLYRTRRWKELRRRVLAEEPLCRYCKQAGRMVPADTVDHIRAHKGDERLFFSRENLQALCASCHNSAKALKERHGYAPGAGLDGMPLDPDHPWGERE